jgi:hypothetical protein
MLPILWSGFRGSLRKSQDREWVISWRARIRSETRDPSNPSWWLQFGESKMIPPRYPQRTSSRRCNTRIHRFCIELFVQHPSLPSICTNRIQERQSAHFRMMYPIWESRIPCSSSHPCPKIKPRYESYLEDPAAIDLPARSVAVVSFKRTILRMFLCPLSCRLVLAPAH